MATVLSIPAYTDSVTSGAKLSASLERCTSRPAFKRALDAQWAISKPPLNGCELEARGRMHALSHLELPWRRFRLDRTDVRDLKQAGSTIRVISKPIIEKNCKTNGT